MAKDHSPHKLRELQQEKKTSVKIERSDGAAEADESLLASKSTARHRRNLIILLVIALVFLLFAMLVPAGIFAGYSTLNSFGKVLEQFATNVGDFFATLAGTHTGGFYDTTICKYACTFVGGAALGACGAVLQGSFRNPLASPSTLGVVAGCVMGGVFYYLLLFDDFVPAVSMSVSSVAGSVDGLNPIAYVWIVYGRAICAVIGGLIVVGIALLVSKAMGGGALSNVVIVVIGQVFTLVIDSSVDALRYYLQISGQYQRSVLVQMADSVPFDKVQSFGDLAFVCIPILAGLLVLFLFRNRLNVLTFTDDEARSFGVNAGKFRAGMLILCTFISGIVVAFCGPVAFVGFVAPHVVRRFVGTNYRYLLPASMLVGAILLTFALLVTSQFDLNVNQGVNLVTSAAGCIVFVVVVFLNRGGVRGKN